MQDKKEFGVNMQSQLDEWKKKADETRSKAKSRGEAFMESMRPDLDKLNSNYEEAKYQLKLLTMSSEDAWHEVRDGFDKAFDTFKSSVDKALSKF